MSSWERVQLVLTRVHDKIGTWYFFWKTDLGRISRAEWSFICSKIELQESSFSNKRTLFRNQCRPPSSQKTLICWSLCGWPNRDVFFSRLSLFSTVFSGFCKTSRSARHEFKMIFNTSYFVCNGPFHWL